VCQCPICLCVLRGGEPACPRCGQALASRPTFVVRPRGSSPWLVAAILAWGSLVAVVGLMVTLAFYWKPIAWKVARLLWAA
jgi:hypothetical protein